MSNTISDETGCSVNIMGAFTTNVFACQRPIHQGFLQHVIIKYYMLTTSIAVLYEQSGF